MTQKSKVKLQHNAVQQSWVNQAGPGNLPMNLVIMAIPRKLL